MWIVTCNVFHVRLLASSISFYKYVKHSRLIRRPFLIFFYYGGTGLKIINPLYFVLYKRFYVKIRQKRLGESRPLLPPDMGFFKEHRFTFSFVKLL